MSSGPGSAVASLRVVIVIIDPLKPIAATIEPVMGDLWRITPDSAEGRDLLNDAAGHGLRMAERED